jgi:ATP-binding cassette subfamily C (CFTR/MRP) protein 1
MQDGKIVQKGKFDELLLQNIGFETIVGAHSKALESVVNAESSSRLFLAGNKNSAETGNEFETENELDNKFQNITKKESSHDVSEDINQKGRLTQDEEREKGGIGRMVYWAYLRAVHGGALVPVTIGAPPPMTSRPLDCRRTLALPCPPGAALTHPEPRRG